MSVKYPICLIGKRHEKSYAGTLQAAAGTKYWVRIEASQQGIPDWGLSSGTGGSGKYFRKMVNVSDVYYAIVSGDTTFSLK
jgi:hypothetical protein